MLQEKEIDRCNMEKLEENFEAVIDRAFDFKESLERQGIKQSDVDLLREKTKRSKFVPRWIHDKQVLTCDLHSFSGNQEEYNIKTRSICHFTLEIQFKTRNCLQTTFQIDLVVLTSKKIAKLLKF